MKNNDLVSVVIPIFNVEKYLEKALLFGTLKLRKRKSKRLLKGFYVEQFSS